MTTRLLTGRQQIWPKITAAAKKASRADVAVAYFGQGGAALLPLKRGSRLVVDASEWRVKTGATCPGELLKLHNKGVAIYSIPELHAKVFAFPKRAFIGSTNVSTASKSHLIEATIESTDSTLVTAARRLVGDLCSSGRLGPAELGSLQDLYRPPQVPARRGHRGREHKRRPAVWVARYHHDNVPKGYAKIADREASAVETMRDADRSTHYLDVTWHQYEPKWHIGDTIVWVSVDEDRSPVHPPCRIIDVRRHKLNGSTYWFTHTEHPFGNRCSYEKMVKALGRGWKQRLQHDGRLKAEHSAELILWWDSRGVRS